MNCSVDKATTQTRLSALQAALNGVTAAAASVTTVQSAIDNDNGFSPATSFALTKGADSFLGTATNSTLNASDKVVGGLRTDSLNITLTDNTTANNVLSAVDAWLACQWLQHGHWRGRYAGCIGLSGYLNAATSQVAAKSKSPLMRNRRRAFLRYFLLHSMLPNAIVS